MNITKEWGRNIAALHNMESEFNTAYSEISQYHDEAYSASAALFLAQAVKSEDKAYKEYKEEKREAERHIKEAEKEFGRAHSLVIKLREEYLH